MAKKKTTQSRHEKVNKAFDKWHDTKETIRGKSIRKYHYDFCVAKVADEFDYSVDTIRKIINGYI